MTMPWPSPAMSMSQLKMRDNRVDFDIYDKVILDALKIHSGSPTSQVVLWVDLYP